MDALLSGLDDGDWARPTPCEGWCVADVVIHLVQTDAMARGSAEGRLAEVLHELTEGAGPANSIDEGAERMVTRARELDPVGTSTGREVLRRWREGAADLRAVLAAGDPHLRVEWVAGSLSLATLTTTRLAETWIHTGDVATAVGATTAPTSRLWLVARLAWRTLPYAFGRAGRTMSGPVAFELDSPSGAPWNFVPTEPALTSVRGPAVDLCAVAARRAVPSTTGLQAEGPDGAAVLELVRTYA